MAWIESGLKRTQKKCFEIHNVQGLRRYSSYLFLQAGYGPAVTVLLFSCLCHCIHCWQVTATVLLRQKPNPDLFDFQTFSSAPTVVDSSLEDIHTVPPHSNKRLYTISFTQAAVHP